MSRRTIAIAALLLCADSAVTDAAVADAAATGSAPGDPAAALCVQNGATVSAETLPNGHIHNVCVFPGGSRIDAGAYFRNKHRLH